MKREQKSVKGFLARLNFNFAKSRGFLNGSLYEYLGIGVLFFVITLFLTNFTLLQGNSQLFVDGPGDGTAGFLWFNTVEPDANPVLGHTDMANYPEGENLFNPTQVTYTLVWSPLWVLSKIFGPVMGLNIVTFFGIFLCAMAMYWLVKRLTSNPYVATFAGYAAAYTPYHLVKSSSHLTYVFSIVFVLILAAFLAYWMKPTIKRAILFALSIAVAFYTDGYFLLIASVFVFCLIISGFVYDLINKKFKSTVLLRVKHAAVVAGVLVLAMIPIGVMQLSQSSGVDKFLSGARGSIQFDIEYYSTRPIDFFVPSSLNPVLSGNEEFKSISTFQNTRSNTSENNTYIGYVLLLLSVVGAVLLSFYLFRPKKSFLKINKYPYIESFKLVYTVAIVSVPVLVWCMLSPSFTIFGIPVVVLSDILLAHDITLWRVMARFYLPLHVVFVLLASVVLSALTYPLLKNGIKKSSRNYIIGVGCVAIALIFTALEYSTALSNTSYRFSNIPDVYTQVRDDKDIKVIAEFPLMDRPLSTNYDFATAQIVHKKKLINTPLTSMTPGTRTALGSSIEAVDYAVSRGADTIITHNLKCDPEKTWGTLKYMDMNKKGTMESSYYGEPICVYSVKKDYVPDTLFAKLKYGTFSDAPLSNARFDEYQALYMEDGWISVVDNKAVTPESGYARFTANIQYSPGVPASDAAMWQVYQEGTLLASGSLPGVISIDKIDVTKEVHVRVTNSQAPIDKPFVISLSNIVVNKND